MEQVVRERLMLADLSRERLEEPRGGGGLRRHEVQERLGSGRPHVGVVERQHARGPRHLTERRQLAHEARVSSVACSIRLPFAVSG